MGKFKNQSSLIESGRLTFSNQTSNNQTRFNSKFDARLKLIQSQNKMQKTSNLDARELLLKRQQQNQIRGLIFDRAAPNRTRTSNNRREPSIIVTGLANVRKDGNTLRVIKHQVNSNRATSDEHRVISDGLNTLVTLKNNLAQQNRQRHTPETEDEDPIQIDKTLNSTNTTFSYQPIKIKIDNNMMHRKHQDEDEEKSNEDFLKKSKIFYNSNLKIVASQPQPQKLSHPGQTMGDSEEMDYEDSAELIRHKQSLSHAQQISFDLLSNGYKLVVSNLHPKVTEDDILELFSDIGPIKRARFLDKGLAEVVYVKLDHAKEAIQKYDKNELDGRPMRIELVQNSSKLTQRYNDFGSEKPKKVESYTSSSSVSAQSRFTSASSVKSMSVRTDLRSAVEETKDIKKALVSLSNRFKTVNASRVGETTEFSLPDSKKLDPNSKVPIDNSIIHQVLFNKKSGAASSNPVTFTVKL